MAFSEELAKRVRPLLVRRKGFSERRMFGGIAYMLNGNMCCGVSNDDLMVRVGPDEADELLGEPHTRVFDMTGRPMKGWLLVAGEGLADDDELKRWVRRAAQFATTLPPK